MVQEYVKENVVERAPVSGAMLAGALLATLAALGGVALIDVALPAPLGPGAPPDRFSALVAHQHLVNLTSIGPRVAGSYENEVAAVGVLVAAIKDIARAASPHNHVELDLHRASGAFPLTFFDGMNNVYRDVQSVVARVRGAGGRSSRTQLLLNCHFDTVPDSPGASDDGAGCAVLLETLRALAAARRPLRHDAVFLFNGAEENIMQASHAFITQHKWAKSIRAFINIEACGAGGREVLFQAGPHDPWIMEVYAGSVPHPFASSLAQELFESGLIPADTDFRIFRDFGRLSGVDLAWSANGYVYHTQLDTADRVPPSALQRTGDNVLALAHGMLSSPSLESAVDGASRQPVFFDVLGARVVSARGPLALLAAAATLALVALKVHCTARDARAKRDVREHGRVVARRVRVHCARGRRGSGRRGGRGRRGAGAARGRRAPQLLLARRAAGAALRRARARRRRAAARPQAPRAASVARLVGLAAGQRRGVRRLGAAAGGVRAAAPALRLRAAAVGAAARARRPDRDARKPARTRAHGGVVRGLPAAAAADVLPGAGRARHVRAHHRPRRRAARPARRADGSGGERAGAGGQQLGAAAAAGLARAAPAGGRPGRAVPGGVRAGSADAAGRALQRRAAAALHAVPRAPRAARARHCHCRPPLLAARARRQHAALRRRLRRGHAVSVADQRGGVRAVGVLRRAVPPARAGLHPARPLAARAAARRPRARARRPRRRAPPPQRHRARGPPQHHRAESRGGDRVAGGGRAHRVEQRGGAAAGGGGVGRAAHVLLLAARGARARRAALGAAPARGGGRAGRRRRAAAPVRGGPRAGRAARRRARRAAARLPARRRALRLARAPAPARGLASRGRRRGRSRGRSAAPTAVEETTPDGAKLPSDLFPSP